MRLTIQIRTDKKIENNDFYNTQREISDNKLISSCKAWLIQNGTRASLDEQIFAYLKTLY